MKETKFRAWVRNYDWDGTKTTPEYKMYPWNGFFFSDESLITGYSGEFPTNDPDVTLMQYTGKQDINGIDIYEDDIIYKELCDPDDPACGSYGATGVVKENPYNMGRIIDSDDVCVFYCVGGANFLFSEVKVIGNIHENPDLVK